MSRLMSLIGALMCAALMVTGCGPREDAGKQDAAVRETPKSTKAGEKPHARDFPPPPPGVVRIQLGAEPFSLDQNLANDIPSSKVLRHLHEGLVRLDNDQVAMPGAAEKWEHNDDYTLWTFHLRPGMKWSNGDPITAHDWVYGLRRILMPSTGAQYAQMVFGFLKGGRKYYDTDGKDDSEFGARAIDDMTLEIALQGPTPFFLSILGHSSWYPLNRNAVEKGGPEWYRSPETYAASGPYNLVEWKPKDRIILKKRADYWDAANVHFDEIVFRLIEDENSGLAGFLSGEYDFIDRIPLSDVKELRETAEWFSSPYLGTYYVCFNVTKPPFDDVALRKAFSMTIRRDLIVERITRRGEIESEGYVPHGITLPDGRDYRAVAPKFIDNVTPWDERVKQAKKLLADAGYGPSKPLPRFEYLYNTSQEHKQIGEQLQYTWKEALGADVRLQNVEWKVKIDRGNAKDYEFGRWGWIGDYSDPMTFLDIFETGGGNNDAGYANPRYDELLQLARHESDVTKRLEYLMEAERLLIEVDCAIAPIYTYAEPILVRTEVKGFVRNALGDLDVSRAWREGEK